MIIITHNKFFQDTLIVTIWKYSQKKHSYRYICLCSCAETGLSLFSKMRNMVSTSQHRIISRNEGTSVAWTNDRSKIFQQTSGVWGIKGWL
jgi:hypothetical protein